MRIAPFSWLWRRVIRRGLTAVRRAPAALAERADRTSKTRRRVTVVLLAVFVVLVASAVAVAGLAVRHGQAVGSARFDAVTQARLRVAQILTYHADTIDADIERARADTAGSFAQYYLPFAQQSIVPAVRQQRTTSVAVVSRAAAISTTTDTVAVVVFIDQQTSSVAQPQPRKTSSTARVTMTKVAGQWLISELTPTSSN
jgi:Mce-associated membrane protein